MSTNSCACSASTDKFVYSFGGGSADGNGSMKNLLGGKGANLAEMARIGLPVPPGFTITTEVCTYYYDHECTYPAQLDAQIKEGIAKMEQILGRKFGDTEAMPMLVAVRSGARESMPGMMDTILNLGLNEKSVEAMVKATGNPRFAWDCYRRFVQMYGDVVLGVQKNPDEDHEPFEAAIAAIKEERYGSPDVEDTKLSADDLKELVSRFKALVLERTGHSRNARGTSSRAPSAPCSVPGTMTAPSFTARNTAFRPNGAPPSTCRPWCSAIRVKNPVPAWRSPATPPPGKTNSTVNS